MNGQSKLSNYKEESRSYSSLLISGVNRWKEFLERINEPLVREENMENEEKSNPLYFIRDVDRAELILDQEYLQDKALAPPDIICLPNSPESAMDLSLTVPGTDLTRLPMVLMSPKSSNDLLLSKVEETKQLPPLATKIIFRISRAEMERFSRDRGKDRTIQEIINIVARWRALQMCGKPEGFTFVDAATEIDINKQTLDDYYARLRKGGVFGFDFASNLGEKIGALNTFLSEKLGEKEEEETTVLPKGWRDIPETETFFKYSDLYGSH